MATTAKRGLYTSPCLWISPVIGTRPNHRLTSVHIPQFIGPCSSIFILILILVCLSPESQNWYYINLHSVFLFVIEFSIMFNVFYVLSIL
ncbi:hypothetical protein FKM82_005870 [Ascaphus truei]